MDVLWFLTPKTNCFSGVTFIIRFISTCCCETQHAFVTLMGCKCCIKFKSYGESLWNWLLVLFAFIWSVKKRYHEMNFML